MISKKIMTQSQLTDMTAKFKRHDFGQTVAHADNTVLAKLGQKC